MPDEPFESDAPPRMVSGVMPAVDRDAFAADLWRTLMRDPSLEAATAGLARGRELGVSFEEMRLLSLRFHCAAGALLEAVATTEDGNAAARDRALEDARDRS